MNLKSQILIENSKEVGFAEPIILSDNIKFYREWLSKGHNADMNYLNKNIGKKLDVKNILPEAKSVIVLAINYFTDVNYSNDKNSGKISRYAVVKDYHIVIKNKLEKLVTVRGYAMAGSFSTKV